MTDDPGDEDTRRGTGPGDPARPVASDAGATTQTSGTAMAVDLASSPRTRRALGMFVAAPTTWFGHFMLVYLVAEAGCTGSGPGLSALDPPVPAVVTIVATVVAVGACGWVTWWHWQQWRHGDRLGSLEQAGGPPGGTDLDGDERPLAFVGVVVGAISLVSVLFVGLPALVLTGC